MKKNSLFVCVFVRVKRQKNTNRPSVGENQLGGWKWVKQGWPWVGVGEMGWDGWKWVKQGWSG